jgi:nicotinamidase-related amidase
MKTAVKPKLHGWHIDPREYARHESRRGWRYAFEQLDPQRTALIVIDLVAFFVAENAYCQGIIPNINALASALRSKDGVVAWVLPEAKPPSPWMLKFYGAQVATSYANSGGKGLLVDRLYLGLNALAADLWVEKSASSAFFPGRCHLPDLLIARNIETVLITGTVTSVCCESSARDASTLGYQVIMVADACAGTNDQAHNATLQNIYRSFGDVRPTSEVLELILH